MKLRGRVAHSCAGMLGAWGHRHGRLCRMDEQRRIMQDMAVHPFTVGEARAAGVSEKRLRGRALAAPFHGVRVAGAAASLVDRARAYGARQRPHHAVSGPAAAAWWGLPLPVHLDEQPVDVLVPIGRNAPRARGVRSRRIRPELWQAVEHRGLRVTPVPLTFLLLARHCTVEELVAVGDAAVTDADNYPGLTARSMTDPASLAAVVAQLPGGIGIRTARAAAALVRTGVESPMETRLRLLLAAAGLPEPELNLRIPVRSGRVYRGDLVYRWARLIIEYDGDHHWRDRAQYERDLLRRRELEDAGWRELRVTASDLRGSARRRALVELVRTTLHRPA